MNVQQHLIDNNIATNLVHAINHLNSELLSTIEYNERLKELGATINIEDQLEAKYTYLYAIQNGLKGDININHSHLQAKQFIANHKWSFTKDDEGSDLVIDKKTGDERRKKGWKKIEAVKIAKEIGLANRAAIIQTFEKKLNMSKSGATTYFYIAKTEIEG